MTFTLKIGKRLYRASFDSVHAQGYNDNQVRKWTWLVNDIRRLDDNVTTDTMVDEIMKIYKIETR